MPKPAKLIVILLTTITFAYLWWDDNSNHRSVPAIESITHLPPVEAVSTSPDKFKTDFETLDENDDTGITQPIEAPDGITVKGWVKDQLGQGISGMQIEISPGVEVAWQQNVYTASTDYNGKFLISAIPPDNEYRLEVLTSGAYAGTLFDPFPVVPDMPAVAITLNSIELVSVAGMIVGVDNAPVTDFEILVQNVSIAYPGRKVVSDSSGFFELAQFPVGQIQMSTSGTEHFMITGLTLQPDEYRNLTLAIDKGSYYLTGWVSDEFDTPIAQARVALTSVFSREDYQSSSYRFKVVDSNSGFEFSGLGGQQHQLTVDAIGYETRVLNFSFQSLADNLNIRLQRK